MLATFLLGYFFGVCSLAVAFDVRRALRSAQERDQEFLQNFAETNRRGH
jgi:hypothetical protein